MSPDHIDIILLHPYRLMSTKSQVPDLWQRMADERADEVWERTERLQRN